MADENQNPGCAADSAAPKQAVVPVDWGASEAQLRLHALELGLQLFNFTNSRWLRWVFRRTLIAAILIGYMLLSIGTVSFVFDALDHVGEKRKEVSRTVVRTADGKTTTQTATESPSATLHLDISEQYKNVLVMMSFGLLGGVFSISRSFLRTFRCADYSVANYMFRPWQSVMMALFIYIAFRAGEVMFFGASSSLNGSSQLNVYALILLAIVTGMFTERAYMLLNEVSKKMLSIKRKGSDGGGNAAPPPQGVPPQAQLPSL